MTDPRSTCNYVTLNFPLGILCITTHTPSISVDLETP